MQSHEKMAVIEDACLQRAKLIETDPGEKPERLTKTDWYVALAAGIGFGAMAFLGYLA